MLKYLILLALVVVATANHIPQPQSQQLDLSERQSLDETNDEMSQLSLRPTDDEEKAGCTGEKVQFADFCITARDETNAYFSSQKNEVAKAALEAILGIITKAGNKILDAQREYGSRTLDEIRQSFDRKPAEEVASEPDDSNSNNNNSVAFDDSEQENQGGWFKQAAEWFSSMYEAFVDSLRPQVESVKQEILAEMNAKLNKEVAIETVVQACDDFNHELKRSLTMKFNSFKNDLFAEMTDQEKLPLNGVSISNVGCKTLSRVSLAGSVCDALKMASDKFGKK